MRFESVRYPITGTGQCVLGHRAGAPSSGQEASGCRGGGVSPVATGHGQARLGVTPLETWRPRVGPLDGNARVCRTLLHGWAAQGFGCGASDRLVPSDSGAPLEAAHRRRCQSSACVHDPNIKRNTLRPAVVVVQATTATGPVQRIAAPAGADRKAFAARTLAPRPRIRKGRP